MSISGAYSVAAIGAILLVYTVDLPAACELSAPAQEHFSQIITLRITGD